MENLKTLRKRIVSVKKTQQITSAMKMIAAVRLRKAQEKIVTMRPYSNALREVMSSVAIRTTSKDHPLLALRPQNNILLFVVSSHRGLCGGFNSSIIKSAVEFTKSAQDSNRTLTWAFAGDKARDFFLRRGKEINHDFPAAVPDVNFLTAVEIAKIFETAFLEKRVDGVYAIYNEFKSAMSQGVLCERILPISASDLPEDGVGNYIYEPTKEEILSDLLLKYLRIQIYRVLLESSASEHGARMTAMDSATNNAKEMIRTLTLLYNQMRQASITKELIEIVSGAEALRA